jgi:large subunit ribosomal protein L15
MQIHEIKLRRRKSRKRVGRGGKRGTYSGRGMKGQKSRSGYKSDPVFEGGRSSLTERLKKVRGFKSTHKKAVIVKYLDISNKFSAKGGPASGWENGAIITLEDLVKNNLIDKKDVKRGVKILGPKDGKKTFTFEEKIKVSKSVL